MSRISYVVQNLRQIHDELRTEADRCRRQIGRGGTYQDWAERIEVAIDDITSGPERWACQRCSHAAGVGHDPTKHVSHAFGEACPHALVKA